MTAAKLIADLEQESLLDTADEEVEFEDDQEDDDPWNVFDDDWLDIEEEEVEFEGDEEEKDDAEA